MRPALLLVLVVLAGCRSAAGRLDALFTDLHRRGLFDGAVVVGEGDRIVYEKGFGYANAERQVRFTPDTPSDSGSLAKTFTAALVLADLHLDEPAQRLLPELPYPAVTLRHLLSHSSGLVSDYGWFDAHLPADRVRTTEVLLAAIAAQKPPLAFEPGTAFEYNSIAYDLASLALARQAKTTYPELLRARIFAPLGITSAFARPGRFADFPGVRTRGYRRVNGRLEPHEVFDFEEFHGGSNIYISARDLHRWNASLMDERPGDYARIGKAPSGLTLGSWYRSDDGSATWYAGHLQGFHNEVFRDARSRRSVVYVSNNTIEPWLQHGIVRAVNAILDGREPRLTAPDVVALKKEDYPSVAGRWSLSDGEALEIDAANGRLSMTRRGVRYGMFPVGSMLYVPGLDFMVGFGERGMYVLTQLDEQWARRP